jgi:HlyD family secretion protein
MHLGKRIAIHHVALAAAFLPLGAACRKQASQAQTKRTAEARKRHRVHTVRVKKKTFRRKIRLDAVFTPSERVLLSPSVPGTIRKIHKREGDRVQKREVLVVVSPKEVYIQTIPLRSQLAAARAKLEAAETILAKVKEPFQRARKLYEKGVISKVKLEEVEVQYTTAQAQKDATARTVKKLKKELQRAYGKLSDTRLRAPFDGFVVRRLADEGELARAFPPTVVLVITRHKPLFVEGQVAERDLVHLRKGMAVTVTVDALQNKRYGGTLLSIRPQLDPITHTARIRAQIPNEDLKVMPGMTGQMMITLPPRKALAIERAHLITEPTAGTAQVFVIENGKAVTRTVQLGEALDTEWVAVRSGLARGERLITDHKGTLQTGDRVEAIHARRQKPPARTGRARPVKKP